MISPPGGRFTDFTSMTGEWTFYTRVHVSYTIAVQVNNVNTVF